MVTQEEPLESSGATAPSAGPVHVLDAAVLFRLAVESAPAAPAQAPGLLDDLESIEP